MNDLTNNDRVSIKTLLHKLRNKMSHIGSYLYNSRLFPKSTEGEELYNMAVTDYKDVSGIIHQINKIVDLDNISKKFGGVEQGFVLIVEDDDILRNGLELKFKEKNMPVLAFPKGEDLSYVDADFAKTLIAIVDYHYEGSPVDGFDVLEYLRRSKITGKIYVCTADYDDKNFQAKFKEYPEVTLLKKPIDFDQFDRIFFSKSLLKGAL